VEGLSKHVLTAVAREGAGWIWQAAWPVPKARGLGLMAGQRGASQGPVLLSSARTGLAGDGLSEAERG